MRLVSVDKIFVCRPAYGGPLQRRGASAARDYPSSAAREEAVLSVLAYFAFVAALTPSRELAFDSGTPASVEEVRRSG